MGNVRKVIDQQPSHTTVKCPKCRKAIVLHHEAVGCANDDFGPMHLGQQRYLRVVCMNLHANTYCDYEGNFVLAHAD